MNTVTHSEVRELLHAVDHRLAELRDIEPDAYQWSDADQLRMLAHGQLRMAHTAFHLMPGVDEVDVETPRLLLRIAARLDLIDAEQT